MGCCYSVIVKFIFFRDVLQFIDCSFNLANGLPTFIHLVVELNVRFASTANDDISQACLFERKRVLKIAYWTFNRNRSVVNKHLDGSYFDNSMKGTKTSSSDNPPCCNVG